MSAERESTGCILGVALGLVVLLGLVAAIATGGLRRADGDVLLAEWFEPADLPFGLVVAEATKARERELVLLENPDAPEEAAAVEVEEDEADGEAEDGGDQEERGEEDESSESEESVDWTKIEMGPEGSDPIEAVVIRYRQVGSGGAQIEAVFGAPDEEDFGSELLMEFGSSGGRAVMDRGRIPWHDYSVLFLHERELEAGGTFRDLFRVNLSLPGNPMLLYVRWPRGFPGSKDKVVELIDALRPKG